MAQRLLMASARLGLWIKQVWFVSETKLLDSILHNVMEIFVCMALYDVRKYFISANLVRSSCQYSRRTLKTKNNPQKSLIYSSCSDVVFQALLAKELNSSWTGPNWIGLSHAKLHILQHELAHSHASSAESPRCG